MLFALWGGSAYRPTRDLDFTGYGDSDPELASRVLQSRAEDVLLRLLQAAGREDRRRVADGGAVVGIEADRLENDDEFMRHLAQVVRNGLGERASTCIDPNTQIVEGKTVCLVTCQRSPEPVFLKWKGMEGGPEGDFYVRSGPGSVRLPAASAKEYIRTRFKGASGR